MKSLLLKPSKAELRFSMTDNEWFKTWFSSPNYLELYKHRDIKDAGRIIRLFFNNIKLNRPANILDLACGNGRHSILFAKKGFNVTGIDLSKYLIEEAKKALKNEFGKYKDLLQFEIKDMRNIDHDTEFDLVVNLFTSFGYFKKDSDNEKVIKGISKALKRGGYFLFDFFNNTYLERNLIPCDIKKFDNKSAVQLRAIKNNTVEKDIYIFSKFKNGFYNPEPIHFKEKIKLYSSDHFRKLFTKYNLSIIYKFGNYDGSRFNKINSKRLIIIAQKEKN